MDRQSLSKTLALRFVAVYFILYSTWTLPPPLRAFPGVTLLELGWNSLVFWVGDQLGIDSMNFGVTGSGDRTADYVALLVIAVLAIMASTAWTAVDRGRTPHPRLGAWLTVWARYWLGAYMIFYGVIKVFPLQMPAPDLIRLTDTYGESSPMGLLWTFMGASPAYSAFAGGAEVLGGVLLFWRRTTSLGALVCMGVLANVVMLNFSYDVPVKLFSLHLFAVALVLASQDAQRLFGVLVLGRAVPAHATPPITTTARGHRIRWTVKGLFLVGLALAMAVTVSESRAWQGRPPVPLYGLYDVVSHELECESSRSCGDELRWRRVVFGRHGNLALDPLQGPRSKYGVTVDEPGGLVLEPHEGGPMMMLDYHEPAEGTLILEGSFGGAEHRITLQRVDDPEFLLVDRGFHWINEYPLSD